MIVWKTHDSKGRHAIRPAGLAVCHIAAEFIQPIPDTRITAKTRLSLISRDGRIDAALRLFVRAIGFDGHRVGSVHIEVAEGRAEMAFDRAFGCESPDRRR